MFREVSARTVAAAHALQQAVDRTHLRIQNIKIYIETGLHDLRSHPDAFRAFLHRKIHYAFLEQVTMLSDKTRVQQLYIAIHFSQRVIDTLGFAHCITYNEHFPAACAFQYLIDIHFTVCHRYDMPLQL